MYLAQEEKATAEAAAVARRKKAAKKARRKERDGAIKAANGSPHIAAVATATGTDATAMDNQKWPPGSPLTATAIEPAAAAAAAAQTAAVAQRTADRGSDTRQGRSEVEDTTEMQVSAHARLPDEATTEQDGRAAAESEVREHQQGFTAGDDMLTQLLGDLYANEGPETDAEPPSGHQQSMSEPQQLSSGAPHTEAHLMCPITKVRLVCCRSTSCLLSA